MTYLRFLLIAFAFLLAIAVWGETQALLLPALTSTGDWGDWGHSEDWTKLLMVPGFLLATGLSAFLGRSHMPRVGHPGPWAWPALLLLPVALNLAAIPLYNLSLHLVPPGDAFFALQRLLEPTGTWPDTLGIILAVALVGPVCEEVVFRGIMMEGLLQGRKNLHVIVWSQALLFGAVHGNPWQFFYAFLIGALFGYLRLWTGGIGLTVGLHVLVNSVSMGSFWLNLDEFTGPTNGSPVQINALWPILGTAVTGIFSLPFFLRSRLLPIQQPVSGLSQ